MSLTYQELADRLERAYRAGPIPPLRDGLGPTDAQGAYAVQSINTLRWQAAGRRLVGRKIGLTAKAVQAQLGVTQPDFGVLFSDMRIEDKGALLASKVLQPKAEAEIALILAADIKSDNATVNDVASATAYAVAAIEIVDSRIADWKIAFADTVADNGSSAFFVLGEARKPMPGLDLFSCGMVMQVNGQIASIGAGAACLGHPLEAAAWLARTLAREGDWLRAGDIVLTGALGPMVGLKPGDEVRAVIGGVGSCQFSFTEDR
jgi:2-keto-4-pentenoate hydratase